MFGEKGGVVFVYQFLHSYQQLLKFGLLSLDQVQLTVHSGAWGRRKRGRGEGEGEVRVRVRGG